MKSYWLPHRSGANAGGGLVSQPVERAAGSDAVRLIEISLADRSGRLRLGDQDGWYLIDRIRAVRQEQLVGFLCAFLSLRY
jgi:hypothetical protein